MRSTCLVSSNLLNEVSSLYFGILKYVCDIVVKRFTFAISSTDEFLIDCVWNNIDDIMIDVHVEYTLLISKLQYSTV